VGLATAREGAAWFYTDVIPVPGSEALHAVDRYWLVAEALGVGSQPKLFRLAIGESERSWANEVLRIFPRPWMAVAAGARWATKRWPPEHFAALLRRAQSSFAGTALFIGGGEDASLAQSIAARLSGPAQDLTGQTSLPQLAALLSLADVMVGNDTGPLHLAVALGRPVVAPYTCTKISWTGPYGQNAHAVATGVACYGSRLRHCRSLQCLGDLTPDRLWPVLKGILNQWETTSRSA
jgi:ADP-heptose:LPS heptosyltransferase